MKARSLSKLEQIKALREGRFDHAAVIAMVEKTPFFEAVKAGRFTPDAAPDAVPWLSPEGQCASCDKRREALKATMRKRRHSTAPRR